MRLFLLAAASLSLALAQDLDTNRVLQRLFQRYEAKLAQARDPELLGCKDVECHQDVYQIITTKGYPCEQHVVTTDDNINLTIFRIPYGRGPFNASVPRPVVFLQHGLLASAADWVINFPQQSLGFMMADAGFDVWLGNVRGNLYGVASLPHKPTAAQEKAFWSFSFDEMAKFDLPAMVTKALTISKASKLAAYIGHSQGTAMGFIHFSNQPDWSLAKIGDFYALAPIAYMGHCTSPLRYIARYSESSIFVRFLQYLFGDYQFLPHEDFIDDLCAIAPKTICGNVLALVAGWDYQNMNNSRLPVYSSKSPSGTSSQNIIHFGQLIQTGQFRAFDYFSSGNQQHYGQKTPPTYYVNQMKVPTHLYWGVKDILADPTDVQALQRDIQNVVDSKSIADMDHLDFVWGLNAASEVYQPIISQLQQKYHMN